VQQNVQQNVQQHSFQFTQMICQHLIVLSRHMPPRYSDYHSIQTSRKDRLCIRNDIVEKLLHSRNIVYQTLHPTCSANWSAPLKVDNYLR